MIHRGLLLLLLFIALGASGCGPGRGEAVIRSRQFVLPDGSTAAVHTLAITAITDDPTIDNAIRQAQQADDAYWHAVQANNAWVTLLYEIRSGLTREQYADRIKRQQLEMWFRTDVTVRDKTEATEQQLRLYDQINAQIVASTTADVQRELREQAAALNSPAAAAYRNLGAVVAPEDALLLTVAAYNQGILIGITGRIYQAKALLKEAHGYAVRHVSVDIIRQCLAGQHELDSLRKQQLLYQVDERDREKRR